MRAPAVIVAALVVCFTVGCDKQPERPRKQQVVKLLPDTPPPPPPPPKPEDRPPPKPDDKPQPQQQPKPADTTQPQALRSDEAAGDGPGGGLSAGAVTQEYTDQKIGAGTVLGGGDAADSAAVRVAANAYARAVTQALNEHLTQDREVKRMDYRVQVELWLSPTGSLQRAELLGSTGDAKADQALRAALASYAGLGRPLPARMPQPLRLQVSNRLIG